MRTMVKRKGTKVNSKKRYTPPKDLLPKTLYCEKCGRRVKNCNYNSVRVICSICVQKMVDPPKQYMNQKNKEEAKPRGWKFMKVFVSKSGDVFYKGEEQPKLKGTLEPTVIIPKPKKKKITVKQKENIEIQKNQFFAEIIKLKKQLAEGNFTTRQRKKIEKEIKLKEKQIKKLSKK